MVFSFWLWVKKSSCLAAVIVWQRGHEDAVFPEKLNHGCAVVAFEIGHAFQVLLFHMAYEFHEDSAVCTKYPTADCVAAIIYAMNPGGRSGEHVGHVFQYGIEKVQPALILEHEIFAFKMFAQSFGQSIVVLIDGLIVSWFLF